MKKQLMVMGLILITMISACKKENQKDIDTEYPVIDITAESSFPKQCSVVKRGETFMFLASVSDNAELGSVSVDIHHNFDHHTHSTEVESCGDLEPIKTPIKPFLLIKSYPITAGLKAYDVQQEIAVPSDVDPGDYHFMIRLTGQGGLAND